ncbi:uncharacterized protein LOC132695793 [Cylas formicarius]|uniref:uncharacterized protein LOC132695793 n=1 Tax=Cylas formicarius TaxID=197179 RepID=UPI0029583DCB|nr:uncharacterized protein LOC132695793 [Cylas formicarius]
MQRNATTNPSPAVEPSSVAPCQSTAAASSSADSPALPWGKKPVSVSFSNRKTSTKSSITAESEHRTILAITGGRGEARCEVGIAAIQLPNSFLTLSQISDTESYLNTLAKINVFDPTEILHPITFESNAGKRMLEQIKAQFPKKKYTTMLRRFFNSIQGLDWLQEYCIPSCYFALVAVKDRYYALAAAAALITYLRETLRVGYVRHSIKLDYQASEGYTIIDVCTADRLELVSCEESEQPNKKKANLFSLLNHCLTRIGVRTLRSMILQPLYSVSYIEQRLSWVNELYENPTVLGALRETLPMLNNIDHLLSMGMVLSESEKFSYRQLNYLLLLNNVVDVVLGLKETIGSLNQDLFTDLVGFLGNEDFTTIRTVLRQILNEDAYPIKGRTSTQRIFAIKYGANGLLDVIRQTYSERVQDIQEYVTKVGAKYNLPLTVANTNSKGYHMVMTLNKQKYGKFQTSSLPLEFIEVCTTRNKLTMKTPELVNLNTRIDDIMQDLISVSNSVIRSVMIDMREHISLFFTLCDKIAYLDVIQSLATVSLCYGYTRPMFANYTEVIHGRHPLLEFLCDEEPVPNSVEVCEHYNVHIISGPNGAGKSVYLRQLMLLQIMAQVGCFVPAQSAVFRSADRMYARITNTDDIESGFSSFVSEIKEVGYMASTMTDHSLIIMDELCNSTSVAEGVSNAMGICSYLATLKAYVFVTTHYALLNKLKDMFLNVKVWQMETLSIGNPEDLKSYKLDFKYRLIPGSTNVQWYGVYMARDAISEDTMEHVIKLAAKVNKRRMNIHVGTVDQSMRLKYQLHCKLGKLKDKNTLTETEVNKCLKAYEEELNKLNTSGDAVPELSTITDELSCSYAWLEDLHLRRENSLNEISAPEENVNLQDLIPEVQLNEGTSILTLLSSSMNDGNSSIGAVENAEEDLSNQLAAIRIATGYDGFLPSGHNDIITSTPARSPSNNNDDGGCPDAEFYSETLNFSYMNPHPILNRPIRSASLHFPCSSNTRCGWSCPNTEFYSKRSNFDEQQQSAVDRQMDDSTLGQENEVHGCPSVDIIEGGQVASENNDGNFGPIFEDEAIIFSNEEIIDEMGSDNYAKPASMEEPISPVVENTDCRGNVSENSDCNRSPTPIPENSAEFDERLEIFETTISLSPLEEHVFPNVEIINGPGSISGDSDDRGKHTEKQEDIFPIVEINDGSGSTSGCSDYYSQNNIVNNMDDWEMRTPICSSGTSFESDGADSSNVNTANFSPDWQFEGFCESEKKTAVDATAKIDTGLSEVSRTNVDDNGNKSSDGTDLNSCPGTSATFNTVEKITKSPIFDDGIQNTSLGKTKINFGPDVIPFLGFEDSEKKLACDDLTRSSASLMERNLNRSLTSVGGDLLSSKASTSADSNKSGTTLQAVTNNTPSTSKVANPASKKSKVEVPSSPTKPNFDPDIPFKGFERTKETVSNDTTKDLTSISAASRKRNLDGNTSSTSNGIDSKKSFPGTPANIKKFKTVSNLSSASRKRNLEVPLALTEASSSMQTTGSTGNGVGSGKRNKKRFVPPIQAMSVRQIKRDFDMQDRVLFEGGADHEDLAKVWQQRRNRPTPNQIKQGTCLMTLVKNQEGFEVIDDKERKNSAAMFKRPSKNIPRTRIGFNTTIFSGENVKTFEQFINSKKDDFRTFNFNLGGNQPHPSGVFQQVITCDVLFFGFHHCRSLIPVNK